MKQIISRAENVLNGISGGVQAGSGRFTNCNGVVRWDTDKLLMAHFPDKYDLKPIINLN